jgi:hypothetical protein
MSKTTVVSTMLAAIFAASMCSACDNNNNHSRYGSGVGTGVTINVEGAIAEGGDGGDGGNAANQGGQIAQDESAAVELETATGF